MTTPDICNFHKIYIEDIIPNSIHVFFPEVENNTLHQDEVNKITINDHRKIFEVHGQNENL